VYRGKAAETAATNAAVAATAGQIVTYEGRPAITYFFASSGGMTEDVQNGFPGAEPEPWLKAVADPYEAASTKWTLNLSFTSVARRLRGLFRGSLRGIEVLRRGASPRILQARVMGTAGASVVGGPQLAARLGLSSTWAYFSVRSNGVLRAEPDHSGRARGSIPTPAPASPPPASAAGGVSPVQSLPSGGSNGASGGTSASG
jgi:stage II sporulation protein D